MLKVTPFLFCLALLAGCSLAPKYERPSPPVANAFPATEGATPAEVRTSATDLGWKQFFGDPRLQRVIQLTLDNNRDLRVAALNVERVRALYNIQRTALIPSLNATGSVYRQRTPGDLNTTGQSILTTSYSLGAEIPSYEVDFFGRVAILRNQVLQQYLASEDARSNTQISLISGAARQYLILLANDEQLTLAKQTLAAAERSYELIKQTYDAGVSTELDLRTAEAQRASVRASMATIAQQRARAENALVLLMGAPLPADLPPAGSLATQNLIDDLPAGLPSDLLSRRPDLRAAEHLLQSANANIGIARAAFFPSVKLTAFDGTASAELSGLFEKGSGSWNFAPSITLPIFASGRNKAQLDVAWTEQRIALANYEKAIQTAFRETADALAVRSLIVAQITAQEDRVAAAKRRYDLTRQRFDAGIDAYLEVLLAQQELFGAQQSLIDTRLARLTNLISLYAALGGGCQDSSMPKSSTK